MNQTLSEIAQGYTALQQPSLEIVQFLALLTLPIGLLYLSILAKIHRYHGLDHYLVMLSIAAFLACDRVSFVHCGAVRALFNFAIAVGVMKSLDILVRWKNLPRYTGSRSSPAAWLLALIFLVELRYESFTPNQIRVRRAAENFSEPTELALHIGVFAILQTLPQDLPTILAFEVLLAIYILWTTLQLLLRYKTSPALFGPLYQADSLTGFWSETWHNAFASPCESLAYKPARKILPRYGVPVVLARSIGVIGAFSLMAIFHMYALRPILPPASIIRIGQFFFLNGIATVFEAMIWGRKTHWLRVVLAWTFETCLATWTAKESRIPNGLTKLRWSHLCY
ncbi:MAG: hypothetical protein M1825_006164 [Sarcosagium campestre]|nr:MAG: hypothetical protein M1825_006164 [Sarcosagium campestre]